MSSEVANALSQYENRAKNLLVRLGQLGEHLKQIQHNPQVNPDWYVGELGTWIILHPSIPLLYHHHQQQQPSSSLSSITHTHNTHTIQAYHRHTFPCQ